ncbi:complement factor H-like [Varanus komodoensis]|uniref:complement factor H-like n=1 Tax=Varanus komodoensis TaxID=61221 RepID=UPI001CF7A758|nr:complement factor H-like [Varanus komodoensis]
MNLQPPGPSTISLNLLCFFLLACSNTPPLHGFFTDPKEHFLLNERIEYRCQDGFTTLQGLDGGSTSCHSTGWVPKPECVKTCSKPTEENASYQSTKLVFRPKEELMYTCNEGFQTLQKASGAKTLCTENGWDPKPACHWHVNPCPPPPASILNGTLISDFAEQYQHGHTVEYECDIKFAMSGSNRIVCVDGNWTSLPTCTEIEQTCGKPPNITNGHAAGIDSEKYWHRATVRYECDNNHVIVGTQPAKCLRGKWELPSCLGKLQHYGIGVVQHLLLLEVRVRPSILEGSFGPRVAQAPEPPSSHHFSSSELCPPPPQLPNAVTIAEKRSYKSGEEISFLCAEHFLLQGPQKIMCEGGKWQPPPHCLG